MSASFSGTKDQPLLSAEAFGEFVNLFSSNPNQLTAWRSLFLQSSIAFIFQIQQQMEAERQDDVKYVPFYVAMLQRLWLQQDGIQKQLIEVEEKIVRARKVLKSPIEHPHDGWEKEERYHISVQLEADEETYRELSASKDDVVYNLCAIVLLTSQERARTNPNQYGAQVLSALRKDAKKETYIKLSRAWQRYKLGLQIVHRLKPYTIQDAKQFDEVDFCYQQPNRVEALNYFMSAADESLLARLTFLQDAAHLSREGLTFEFLPLMRSVAGAGRPHRNIKSYTIAEALEEIIAFTRDAKTEGDVYIHTRAKNLTKEMTNPRHDSKSSRGAREDFSFIPNSMSDAEAIFGDAKRALLGRDGFSTLHLKGYFGQIKCAAEKSHMIAKIHAANFYSLGLHNHDGIPDVANAIKLYCEVIDELLSNPNKENHKKAKEIHDKRLSRLKIVALPSEKEKIATYDKKIVESIAAYDPEEKELIARINDEQNPDPQAWVDLMASYVRRANILIMQQRDRMVALFQQGKVESSDSKETVSELAEGLLVKAYHYGSSAAHEELSKRKVLKGFVVVQRPEWQTFDNALSSLGALIALAKGKKEDARKRLEDMIYGPILLGKFSVQYSSALQIAQQKYLWKMATEAVIEIYENNLFSYDDFISKAIGKERVEKKRLASHAASLQKPEISFPNNQAFANYVKLRLQNFVDPPRQIAKGDKKDYGHDEAKLNARSAAAVAPRTTTNGNGFFDGLMSWISAEAAGSAAAAGVAAAPPSPSRKPPFGH